MRASRIIQATLFVGSVMMSDGFPLAARSTSPTTVRSPVKNDQSSTISQRHVVYIQAPPTNVMRMVIQEVSEGALPSFDMVTRNIDWLGKQMAQTQRFFTNVAFLDYRCPSRDHQAYSKTMRVGCVLGTATRQISFPLQAYVSTNGHFSPIGADEAAQQQYKFSALLADAAVKHVDVEVAIFPSADSSNADLHPLMRTYLMGKNGVAWAFVTTGLPQYDSDDQQAVLSLTLLSN